MSASVAQSVERLRAIIGAQSIDTAVILGTGLGAGAGTTEGDCLIPYAELPGFPQASVSGHAGRLLLRAHQGHFTAFLLGRAHYYEAGDARAMAGALEVLAQLGTRDLIITCASGSTRPDIAPGALVLLSDHINFSGMNPLIGTQGDARFVPMVGAYDAALAARLRRAAQSCDISLRECVYMWFSGPSFETPAEVRMAGLLGADLVGMSCVPEVILARHLGLRVAGLSIVTNFGAGIAGGAPDHAETKRVAAQAADRMRMLIANYLAQEAS